jgi:hypothetical protein
LAAGCQQQSGSGLPQSKGPNSSILWISLKSLGTTDKHGSTLMATMARKKSSRLAERGEMATLVEQER